MVAVRKSPRPCILSGSFSLTSSPTYASHHSWRMGGCGDTGRTRLRTPSIVYRPGQGTQESPLRTHIPAGWETKRNLGWRVLSRALSWPQRAALTEREGGANGGGSEVTSGLGCLFGLEKGGGGRSARRAGERRCLWRSAEADRIRWLPSPLPCTGWGLPSGGATRRVRRPWRSRDSTSATTEGPSGSPGCWPPSPVWPPVFLTPFRRVWRMSLDRLRLFLLWEMAVAPFCHCHYYLWFGSRSSLSGSSVAREGCRESTFSRLPPPSSPFNPRSGTLFPLPPTATSATKLIVSPHFTPARRHAQPLLAARARSSRSWGGGRERGGGTGGLASVRGERSATVHGPVSFWSPFSLFLALTYPLFLVVLYPMFWIGGPWGYWEPLLQEGFEPDEF